LAALPNPLIERPARARASPHGDDVLSAALRAVRLSGSLQFCFMPSGEWQTDATPSLTGLAARPAATMPFHIVVEGTCWLRVNEQQLTLSAGDIVAFPFGTGHQLGVGRGDGALITPVRDLPAKPWRQVPVMRYGPGDQPVRLLCGYLDFAAAGFRPLQEALPMVLCVSTAEAEDVGWLRTIVAQIVREVDRPHSGGISMLERLTEITFIELLRNYVSRADHESGGWLAAMTDPALSRCLSLIHADPGRDWSGPQLAAASGLSRSALTERFKTMLDTSPMRYVREWRLCLASVALGTTPAPIAQVAHDAGYGTEAAFNRAFSRVYGVPPAAWRGARRTATPVDSRAR
jgi:AraC-like DNA-binding protein